MSGAEVFEFDDLQGLLRFGHGKLSECCLMLLRVTDPQAARDWLMRAPVTDAGSKARQPVPQQDAAHQ